MNFSEFVSGTSGKSGHYYGDRVRVFFFVAGALMLLGLPFFQTEIPFSLSLSLGAIILLVFFAGLTNPKQVWLTFLDTLVSLAGIVVFEFYAINNSSNVGGFFLVNQFLALTFFLAFYFSVKSLRGFYLKDK